MGEGLLDLPLEPDALADDLGSGEGGDLADPDPGGPDISLNVVG